MNGDAALRMACKRLVATLAAALHKERMLNPPI
jgi:hypothetical protein